MIPVVKGLFMQQRELGDERSANGLDGEEACRLVSQAVLTKHIRVGQARAQAEDSGDNRKEAMTPVVEELQEQPEELGNECSTRSVDEEKACEFEFEVESDLLEAIRSGELGADTDSLVDDGLLEAAKKNERMELGATTERSTIVMKQRPANS